MTTHFTHDAHHYQAQGEEIHAKIDGKWQHICTVTHCTMTESYYVSTPKGFSYQATHDWNLPTKLSVFEWAVNEYITFTETYWGENNEA